MKKKILEVKNLSIDFNTHNGVVSAVRNVSFDLFKGETLAIVGESGSGKSVTTKAILKILAKNAMLSSGEIIYDQEDLLKKTENEMTGIRGNRIALIFQDPLSALNPIMKIGKQIREAVRLSGNYTKAEQYQRVIELMDLVGIPEPEKRYHQYPFQFSGGMRQRIVIAIALACDPEMLICDEPTTALDVTIQARIISLIKRIKEERGLSVIFITHDLGVVANIADRIHVMYAGKIVEYGTSNEIFYEPEHPYTWSLLASMPDLDTKDELFAIPGTPPNMLFPPKGDAFAPRSQYAMAIDYDQEPPFFHLSETHAAATWRLHPHAPEMAMPEVLRKRIERMKVADE